MVEEEEQDGSEVEASEAANESFASVVRGNSILLKAVVLLIFVGALAAIWLQS